MIQPDETTLKYMEGRSRQAFVPVYGDPDAAYVRTLEIDVASLEPQVAVPPQPTSTRALADVAGTEIQQAYIGGCTGGGIEDMRMAAEVMTLSRAESSEVSEPRETRILRRSARSWRFMITLSGPSGSATLKVRCGVSPPALLPI